MLTQITHYIYLPMLVYACIPLLSILKQYRLKESISRSHICLLGVALIFSFGFPHL